MLVLLYDTNTKGKDTPMQAFELAHVLAILLCSPLPNLPLLLLLPIFTRLTSLRCIAIASLIAIDTVDAGF